MESLNDKLKALGVNLGVGNLRPPKTEVSNSTTPPYFPIEKVVNGVDISTPYGSAYLISNTYPRNFQNPHDLSRPARISPTLLDETPGTPRFIFLDTETSGLSGGSGTFAFLIGLGYFEQDHFLLHQIFMRHPEEEQGVIAALNSLIGDTNILVTFNGKSFDVPLLNTRHKLHGFSPVFQNDTHIHIDMLTFARRIWKNRLPSRSLGDLEKQILNIYRTDEEVPGYMIPDIYFDYLATGDARPISKVIYHNAMDIISLAILFNYTNEILLKPLTQDIDPLDLAAIARIFENNQNIEEAVELYKAALEQGLPVDIYIQTIMRYANIYKREKAWQNAIILWEKAVDAGSIEAGLELAKYYEHQVNDISLAIVWTQKLIEINQAVTKQVWSSRQTEKELLHRLSRLEKKLTNATG